MMLRFCKSRTYHDPLHGAIQLDGQNAGEALLIRLIDTPTFQRLRRIRQLDTACFTFHGAEGSRFTHSVGVLHVARRVFDRLAHQTPALKPYRDVVLTAALLHDVGHSPFSHAGEEIFGSHHEHWTQRIILEDPQISPLLRAHDPELPAHLIAVFQHRFPVPLVTQLISSQLDCDRLDYLLRDSHFTGAQYGHLDLDRIITVMQCDRERLSLVIPARKGLGAIEHYLVVRYFMYTQVYQHPKSIAARFVLQKLYDRARELVRQGELSADPILTAWLSEPVDQLPLATYLAADDILCLYPLRFWCDHPDPILADLARRYLDRDLFKALNVSHLRDGRWPVGDDRESLRQFIRDRLPYPDYYFGERSAQVRGYSLYQEGIMLQTESGQEEIATLSPLVHALIDTPNQLGP
ncbi:MAG: HD domain-containing protein, partial [Synechococcaceae cyanobacterium SM2_3_60]|nr:HD domain-containing protein [Synechococcaceae cyanobacterium SM2_3_60]